MPLEPSDPYGHPPPWFRDMVFRQYQALHCLGMKNRGDEFNRSVWGLVLPGMNYRVAVSNWFIEFYQNPGFTSPRAPTPEGLASLRAHSSNGEGADRHAAFFGEGFLAFRRAAVVERAIPECLGIYTNVVRAQADALLISLTEMKGGRF